MTPLPTGPWREVSIDFYEVSRYYVLVVIGDVSRFPEIEIVHSAGAKAVISKLDRMFDGYDIPEVVKSDNGPPFNGHESVLVSNTVMCPPYGQKQMVKLSVLCRLLAKYCSPLVTGNKRCTIFFSITWPLLNALRLFPLLLPCLDD